MDPNYSDGSGKYLAANWTSSDDTIVSVDGTTLSAKRRGTAIVTAAAAGRIASETFVVQPGIAGSWAGTYVVGFEVRITGIASHAQVLARLDKVTRR